MRTAHSIRPLHMYAATTQGASLPAGFAAARRGLASRRAASSSSLPPSPLPGTELMEWVRHHGGTVDGVSVRQWDGADGGSGFGLQAARACQAGEPLIVLPHRTHLTYDAATDPQEMLELIKRVPAELWGAKLALQLLAKRLDGPAGSHVPYISLLPRGFPGLPIFFPPDAVAALQYPPVSEQVRRRCRWLLGFSKDVLGPLRGTLEDPFHGADVDANALGWALGAVTSRAFRVSGPTQPAALLPLVDMANHSFNPNAKVVPSPTGAGALALVATRDIGPSEPVLLSYGSLPNDFLLLDYGFVAVDNPHDTVQLRFDRGLVEAAKAVGNVGSASEPDDGALPPLPSWKTRALAGLRLAGEGADTEVAIRQVLGDSDQGAACPVDARLLGGVRVLCAATAREVEGRSAEQLGDWNTPVSARNETAALRTLTGLCAIALSQFTSSADEDAAMLRTGVHATTGAALSQDVQLAVQFRLEKKKLLARAINSLSGRLAGQGTGGTGDGQPAAKKKGASSKGFG